VSSENAKRRLTLNRSNGEKREIFNSLCFHHRESAHQRAGSHQLDFGDLGDIFARLGRKGAPSMDPSVVSALSAILGSLVGGSATIATAWITQKTQSRRELVGAEIRKRELLYTEFIAECSKLAIDALDHTLDEPTKLFQVYALHNRMRLVSSDVVVAAADQTVKHILKNYFGPNMTRQEIRDLALSGPQDPLKPFSEACRNELKALQQHAA
jgi:hypothetical protein